jgi:uncharacterized protein (TIGR03663 family)
MYPAGQLVGPAETRGLRAEILFGETGFHALLQTALVMKAHRLAPSLQFMLFALAGIICVGFGLWLRLDSLETRPLHADEATGARILAERLETGSYAFDPTHFHGPLLTAMTEPIARLRGETGWRSLSPTTLRLGPAVIGGLTLLLALAFYPFLGSRMGSLAGAAFIATSPILLYYSRMFIHETLFGFVAVGTVLVLLLYLHKPAWWTGALLGVAAGLLMATRETFIICFMAWAGAGLLVGLEYGRRSPFLPPNRALIRALLRDGLVAGGTAALIVAAFYTHGGSHPGGMLDFFRTFFFYETGAGHDKPFYYFGWLLLWPKFQGGVWWTEAGIGLCAILGFALSFRHRQGVWIRFLFYAGLIQWVIYSLISYKTPWLILVAWLHLCLVAGAGIGLLWRRPGQTGKWVSLMLVVSLLWWQNTQANRAAHRYASDARNPYAYAPTSSDVVRAGTFLTELADLFPAIQAGPVAIVGRDYWPLPWYLRQLPATGYWSTLPENGPTFPVLLILPSQTETAREQVGDTHVFLPRGLRVNTPFTLLIRNDLWEAYLNLEDDR